jgi:hypothetical protein
MELLQRNKVVLLFLLARNPLLWDLLPFPGLVLVLCLDDLPDCLVQADQFRRLPELALLEIPR